jgi:hypothetical protein
VQNKDVLVRDRQRVTVQQPSREAVHQLDDPRGILVNDFEEASGPAGLHGHEV